jgi:hypothetical protein
MSVTRYFNGFLLDAGRSQILKDSSVSFSPAFVTSCRYWLAANSIWAALVAAASIIVAMRLRIDKSWLFIAFVILLAAGCVFRELRKTKLSVSTFLILILAVASPGFLLWSRLINGAFVSLTGDPFFYSAIGQYLTDHHRGIKFGLPPIDQYATLQSETRMGTASILGFFAVLFHSSTAAALSFYVFIVLANLFSGFVLLSRCFGCNRLFSLAAGLFAVIGGWTPNALNIGGLDNLLFLSLIPFLVVRLQLYRIGPKTWPTSLGLATVTAAVFYSYPEGVIIAGAMFLPFFCESLWFGMYRRGKAWRRYVISACLVLVFISPFVRLFFTSLFANINIHVQLKAAAGIFPGLLLSPRFLPALFGFGPEYPGMICSPHDLVLPLIMLALIVLGCATWIRRRKSLILSFFIFITMAIWQGSFQQYDYGLYKILFIGSLIWVPSLFRGGTAVAYLVPKPTQLCAATLGTIVFFSGGVAQRMEQHEKIPFRELKPIKWYSDLAGIKHIVGNRTVLLVCDDAFDRVYNAFDQNWAVFFLRHVNIKVPAYYGYLGAFDSFMQRAKSPSEPADFVLVNEPIEGAVWKNERFSLLEPGSQAKIIGVQSANGLEQVNGKSFIWLGNKASRFLIISKMAQTANFSAWLTGPSRLEEKHPQIRISVGDNVWQADVSETLSIEVPLRPGLNYLDIACQDSPTVPAKSEDDPRGPPLGLWDYRISNREEVSN